MPKGHWKCMGNITPRKIVFLTVNIFAVQEYCSGIPEAEIFGRKRKFSAFGLRFRPPNLKAEYGRKSNFRFFSKWTVKLETVVDILVGQIEARLNENKSKPNDSDVNLNFEKSMANIIQSQSKTQNYSIDDNLKFTIKGDLQNMYFRLRYSA